MARSLGTSSYDTYEDWPKEIRPEGQFLAADVHHNTKPRRLHKFSFSSNLLSVFQNRSTDTSISGCSAQASSSSPSTKSFSESTFIRERGGQYPSTRRSDSMPTVEPTTTTFEQPKIRRVVSRFLRIRPSHGALKKRTSSNNMNRQVGPNNAPSPSRERKWPSLKVAIPRSQVFTFRSHVHQPSTKDSTFSSMVLSLPQKQSMSPPLDEQLAHKPSNQQTAAFPFPLPFTPLSRPTVPPRSRNSISPSREPPPTDRDGSPDYTQLRRPLRRLPSDVVESLGGNRPVVGSTLPPAKELKQFSLSPPTITLPAVAPVAVPDAVQWRQSSASYHISEPSAEDDSIALFHGSTTSSRGTTIHSEIFQSRPSMAPSHFSNWTTSTDETNINRSACPSPAPNPTPRSPASSVFLSMARKLKSRSAPCIRPEAVNLEREDPFSKVSTMITTATQTNEVAPSATSLSSEGASDSSNASDRSKKLISEYSKLVSGHTVGLWRNQVISAKNSDLTVMERLESFELAGRMLRELSEREKQTKSKGKGLEQVSG